MAPKGRTEFRDLMRAHSYIAMAIVLGGLVTALWLILNRVIGPAEGLFLIALTVAVSLAIGGLPIFKD